MSSSHGTTAPSLVLVICAPDDLPAVRVLAQRLRADRLELSFAAELMSGSGGSPRALREALNSAAILIVCLSRRASAAGLPTSVASILELLPLLPAPKRLTVALRLAAVEPPPALAAALALDLFTARGYEQLRTTLVGHLTAIAPPEPPVAAPAPEPLPTLPALKLRGGFGLPALDRQGLVRRLGRGVARAIFLIDSGHALVVSGGGPALVNLAGGPPSWAIDCPARRAALSPNGRLLALAAGNQIYLWELSEGRLLGTLAGHTDTISGLAFAPDERTLASASHDRSVRLWRIGDDAAPAAPYATLSDHPDRASSVCFSPDGNLIASGGADRTVRIWRSFDRSRVQTLGGHGGAVEALAFSPDGATLAAGSRGRSVRLWDVRNWRILRHLDGHEGAVEALAFSPDGALLATGASDGAAQLWRVSDGALSATLAGHNGPVVGVAFSPAGNLVASVGEDERLLSWELPSGTQSAAMRPLSGRVSSLALNEDGTLLAVGAGDGSLAVYGLEAEGGVRTRYDDHRGAIGAVAFAGSSRLIAASSDRTIRAWRLEGGGGSVLLQTHGALQSAALSVDGRILANSDGEGTVQLWRLGDADAAASQFWRVLRGLLGRPRRIVFSPRSDAIAVAGDDGGISIWRLNEAQGEQSAPALTLTLSGGPPRSLALSADGALIAAGSDQGSIQLWRSANGSAQATLQSQGGAVTSLAFAVDGRLLAAGSAAGTVQIWRLNSGDARRRRPAPTVILGHAGAVEHLAFTPGGALVSGSSDGTVRVWKV